MVHQIDFDTLIVSVEQSVKVVTKNKAYSASYKSCQGDRITAPSPHHGSLYRLYICMCNLYSV